MTGHINIFRFLVLCIINTRHSDLQNKNMFFISEEIIETVHDLQSLDASQVRNVNKSYPLNKSYLVILTKVIPSHINLPTFD